MSAIGNLFGGNNGPQITNTNGQSGTTAGQTGLSWGNGLDYSGYQNSVDQAQNLALQQAQQQASGQTAAQQAQNSLMGTLASQAQGRGPNIANQQLQNATQQNSAQQAGAIASQKGINPGLANRAINQSTAAANQGAAGQASVNRMQQQLNAQQGLGALAGQARGQDLASQQAAQGLLGTAGGLQGQQNQTALGNSGLNAQLQNQTAIANLGAQQATSQQGMGELGGLAGTAASIIGAAAWKGGTIPEPHFDADMPDVGALSGAGSAMTPDLGMNVTAPQLGGGPNDASGLSLSNPNQNGPTMTTDPSGLGLSPSGANNAQGIGLQSPIPRTTGPSVPDPAKKSKVLQGTSDALATLGKSLSDSQGGDGGGNPTMRFLTPLAGSLPPPHYAFGGMPYADGGRVESDAEAAHTRSMGRYIDAATVPNPDRKQQNQTERAAKEQEMLFAHARGGEPLKSFALGGMLKENYASGGRVHRPVNVVLSPGEQVLSPEQAHAPNAPQIAAKVVAKKGRGMPLQQGGKVPGKAPIRGDDPRNDTYHTVLPAGSEVLPRSVTESRNAPRKAMSFVEAQQMKRAAQMPSGGFGRVLAAKRESDRRQAVLHALDRRK